MKKSILISSCGVFCILLTGTYLYKNHINKNTFSLNLIHTNDIHSHLLGFNEAMQDCQNNEKCFGGIARIKTFIDENKNENSILLDAGDWFSGTPFYAEKKTKALIPAFNALHYDAFTLGNHEFDDSLGVLKDFVENINAPTINANIDFFKNKDLKKKIPDYIIIQKGNQKIGIIGALTPHIAQEAMHGDQVKIKDSNSAILKAISNLKKQNVAIIILLSHMGVDIDTKIAIAIPEIDVIVGGHTHTLFSNTESNIPYPIEIKHKKGKTLIVSAGAFGKFVGKLDLKFNSQGEIINFQGNTFCQDSNIPENPKIAHFIDQEKKEIETTLNQKIGVIDQDFGFNGTDFCDINCPIGTKIANMLLKTNPNADIVLINSGAFRAGFKKGTVLKKDLMQIVPFDGTLALIQLTGPELQNYINHGLKNYTPHRRNNHVLQMAGGSYQWDEAQKSIHIQLLNKSFDLNAQYNVLVPLFLAKGGDGFPPYPFKIPPKTIVEYLIDYFKK